MGRWTSAVRGDVVLGESADHWLPKSPVTPASQLSRSPVIAGSRSSRYLCSRSLAAAGTRSRLPGELGVEGRMAPDAAASSSLPTSRRLPFQLMPPRTRTQVPRDLRFSRGRYWRRASAKRRRHDRRRRPTVVSVRKPPGKRVSVGNVRPRVISPAMEVRDSQAMPTREHLAPAPA